MYVNHNGRTTLLGADDKAGIAEIMTACEEIIEKKIPHGKFASVSRRTKKLVGNGKFRYSGIWC
jgi:hypothetical protein